MMICLYGTVVASPAANTPGMEVWPRASTTISPYLLSSTAPFSHSVLGTRPIWINTPSSSIWCSCEVVRSLYDRPRSEEHTSELQSLMRTSYAVFCLKKKNYSNHMNEQ